MDEQPKPEFSAGENGITIDAPIEEAKPQLAEAKPPKKSNKKRWILLGVVLVIIVGLAIAATQIDFGAISDNLSTIGYELPPEIQELAETIELTDDGMRILKATHPERQTAEEFNQSCTNNDNGVILLGCYVDRSDRLFIYAIDNKEISSIQNSTLAHELLHAVYHRLSASEREALEAPLKEIYDKNEDIRKHLELYTDNALYDELHSVVGTQYPINEMPELLQRHYSKYFRNQEVVYGLYKEYYSIFEEARVRAKELKEQIDEHRENIKKMQADYNEENTKLTQDVNDFNTRARNGSFTSIEQFETERAALVERKNNLKNSYNELKAYIDETNTLVAEYNNNSARSNELQDSINSNISKPEDNN